jgi:putative restriction endonuclease
MGFAVFVHRADSIYDDRLDQQYQFPRQYLGRVRAAVGDWIVYYEPTKVVGTRGYFAVAKVSDVVPDRTASDMFLALLEPGTYLEFPTEIPFVLTGGYTESGLLNEAGRLSGRAQAAVRPLTAADFDRIVTLGLHENGATLPRSFEADADLAQPEFDEEQARFDIGERARATYLMSRPIRDRVFRTLVLRAYDERCAVTGFKFINGGGRAEVAAAHIVPVEHDGSDRVQNGVALSGTAHWMFDRGLITFTDDLEILISRHVNDRGGAEALINSTGRLIGPSSARYRPSPLLLLWHRENVFKR